MDNMYRVYTVAEINVILADLKRHFISLATAAMPGSEEAELPAYVVQGGILYPTDNVILILIVQDTLVSEDLTGRSMEVRYAADNEIKTVSGTIERYSIAKPNLHPAVGLEGDNDPFVVQVDIPGFVRGGSLSAEILPQ